MKILYLPNWKVKKTDDIPTDLRYADYYCNKVQYWVFRYFNTDVEVDVIDISSCKFLENFEKNKLKFYIIQALKAIPRANRYDFVISDGVQSAAVIALWRKLFRGKYKHIVFDVGSFNGGKESGISTRLLQFVSTTFDGLIYHTPMQIEFYKKIYPWLEHKAVFMELGIDTDFFDKKNLDNYMLLPDKYILCIGYQKRDIKTLIKSFEMINDSNIKLLIVGKKEDYNNENIISFPKVNNSTLCEIIRKSYICVLPLEEFNYSYGQLTLLQQMYFGKAIVTARVGSLSHYTKDGEDCLLYEPLDSCDLYNKINKLLSDKSLINEIGKNARKKVINRFSGKAMAKELEKYLISFIREK